MSRREQELWGYIEELRQRLLAVRDFSEQTTSAGKEYRVERDGRERGGLILALAMSDRRRAEQERQSLAQQIREAIESYAAEWQPGWKIPLDWMECDGRPWFRGKPDGLHLRPVGRRERIEIVRDGLRLPDDVLPFPQVRDGEETVETVGSLVVLIVQVPRRSGEEWETGRIDPRRHHLGRW